MKRAFTTALTAALLLLTLPTGATDFFASDEGGEDKTTRDDVHFLSKAPPFEEIVGKAQKVYAHVQIGDLADIAESSKAIFQVDLNTVKTGISLRDRHMRGYLNADKHPNAVFLLKKVEAVYTLSDKAEKDADGGGGKKNKNEDAKEEPIKTAVKALEPGVETYLDATGTLTINGVEREIELEQLRVVYTPEKTPESAAENASENAPENDETRSVRKGDMLQVAGSFAVKLSEFNIKRPRFALLSVSDDVIIEIDVILGTGEKMVVSVPKEEENEESEEAEEEAEKEKE